MSERNVYEVGEDIEKGDLLVVKEDGKVYRASTCPYCDYPLAQDGAHMRIDDSNRCADRSMLRDARRERDEIRAQAASLRTALEEIADEDCDAFARRSVMLARAALKRS